MEINSINNTKVKQWMKYHQKKYRDLDQRFLVEGEHLIQEAITANVLDVLLVRAGCSNIFDTTKNIYVLDDLIIDKLSKNVSSVNYIGVVHQRKVESQNQNRVLLLDGIQDPGNLGTMIRSAYSFGFQAIYCSLDCVDVYNEKVIRSTQGALFHVDLIRSPLEPVIQDLKQNGVNIYATALKDAKPLSMIPNSNKIALIFGNEGSGVSKSILLQADDSIKIETKAFESLNVGVAASICMYHFRER